VSVSVPNSPEPLDAAETLLTARPVIPRRRGRGRDAVAVVAPLKPDSSCAEGESSAPPPGLSRSVLRRVERDRRSLAAEAVAFPFAARETASAKDSSSSAVSEGASESATSLITRWSAVRGLGCGLFGFLGDGDRFSSLADTACRDRAPVGERVPSRSAK
jgi:hypothetical protein